MRFHADLHIHSKYSRATSRDSSTSNICPRGPAARGSRWWGPATSRIRPGVRSWKQKLVPAEPGLLLASPKIERAIERSLPPACQAVTRFMLTVEISTIYKKADRTRKVHHCLFAPDFDTADRISAALARIGNIASDGRPILGLDSRNLLEITLESDPGAYLIPAHTWTPWFSLLGRSRGSIRSTACYGDHTPPHRRGGDRPVVRSVHELAAVGARSRRPGQQLRRPFTGQARTRGDHVRYRRQLLRDPPRPRNRQRLRRHRRVLPRGREVSRGRSSEMQCPSVAGGDAGERRALPGLRRPDHGRRAAPRGSAGGLW